MKTRHVALTIGILLTAATGSAFAHDNGYYPPPPPRVGGSVTVYGGSHGVAGWSGMLQIGTPVVLGAAYAPVVAVPAHRHGPRCGHRHHYGHGHGHGHGKAYRAGYRQGYANAHHHERRYD